MTNQTDQTFIITKKTAACAKTKDINPRLMSKGL
jgi:hypothetical protein